MNNNHIAQTGSARKPVSPEIAIDQEGAKLHLDALLGRDSAHENFLFVALDDRKEGRPAATRYGSLSQHAGELGRLNAEGFGIFVTVNETVGASRKATDIVKVRAHFVDLDGADVAEDLKKAAAWSLRPHFILQSSPGRCHVYWRVAGDHLDEVGFHRRQKKLAQLFNGDSNVCDLPRIMRLAGSRHMKRKPYRCRGEVSAESRAYRPGQFDDALVGVQLPSAGAGTGGPGSPVGHPAHRAPSIEMAIEALQRIPCESLDREEWVAVAHAYKAAVGADDLDAYLAFDDWCSGYPDNTPEGNEKLWTSITESRVGWSELARRAGPEMVAKGAATFFQDIEVKPAAGHDERPEPEDLWDTSDALPDLPGDAAPAIVERFAADQARRKGVGCGAMTAVINTALASLVPSTNKMQVRQNDPHWTARPNIWCALVGDSSANKSASLTAATLPVEGVEAKWRAEYANELRQRQAEERLASADDAGGKKKPRDSATKPPLRRKIVSDATTEAIAALARDNPDGLLAFHDELTGLFGGMDAYRSGGAGRVSKDRSFWLKAKDGAPHTVDRKTSDPILIESCSIGVLGGIQPKKLDRLLPEATEDGFLQRFWLIHLPNSSPGQDVAADENLDAQIARIADRLANEAPKGQLYTFAPEAGQLIRQVEQWSFEEARREELAEPLKNWLRKLPNEAARLSLVYHFIEWAAAESEQHPVDDQPGESVSLDAATRACRFLKEFVFPHVQQLYNSEDGQHKGDARWLGGLILARDMRELKDREIQHAGSRLKGRDKRDARIEALNELYVRGWIEPDHAGGKTFRWLVNPKVHDGRFESVAQSELERRADQRASIAKEIANRKGERSA